jgi:hypothetical protein
MHHRGWTRQGIAINPEVTDAIGIAHLLYGLFDDFLDFLMRVIDVDTGTDNPSIENTPSSCLRDIVIAGFLAWYRSIYILF